MVFAAFMRAWLLRRIKDYRAGSKMDSQLQQLIELQTKQNRLLERYLWRFRFSLITLLLLTTAICCGLGFVIYTQQISSRNGVTIVPGTGLFPSNPNVSLQITTSPTRATPVTDENGEPIFESRGAPIPAPSAGADPSNPFK